MKYRKLTKANLFLSEVTPARDAGNWIWLSLSGLCEEFVK